MLEPLLAVAGRQIFRSDILLIESIVAQHKHDGVSGIAAALCQAWCWRRRGRPHVDGAERVLVALAYRGIIQIPGWRAARSLQRVASMKDEWEESGLSGKLSEFPPVRLRLAEAPDEVDLFDGLLQRHHYLGGRRVIGENLKYLAFIGARPVAALLWGRAALKLSARDRFIGWTPQERRQGIGLIANNYRFLILPWVHIRYLGSHVLSLNVRTITADWERRFGIKLRYLESFVDPERFQATCYLAANWRAVGLTEGSGRRGPQYHFHGSRKLVLVYPLSRSLRASSHSQQVTEILRSRQLTVLPKPCVRHEGDTALAQALSDAAHFNGELNLEQMTELVEELNTYCVHFHDLFHRSELREHFELQIHSMLSQLEKKNVEFIALQNGTQIPVRTLQHFMSSSPWSDVEVRIRHQAFVAQTFGHLEGVLIIDGSDFAKKGKDSAGVARQYCGATGKIDNCQAGVFAAYAHPDGMATLVDGQLYLPECWFPPKQQKEQETPQEREEREERERRWKACHIPPDTVFKTKPELAVEMIESVHARGVLPFRYVVADEGYGANPRFLDGIPKDVYYFCEVPKTTLVWPFPPPPDPEQETSAVTEPVQVQTVAQGSGLEWQLGVTLKEGAHGPIVADVARARVTRTHKHGKTWVYDAEVWLFLRRNPTTGELKYYLSSLPADARLEQLIWLSAMRWPVETCFQESKDYIGMDHYQVRSWRGWQHHMTLTFLSHHFLTHLRRRGKKNALMAPNE